MGDFSTQYLYGFVPRVQHPYQPCLVFPRVFTAAECNRIIEHGLSLHVDEAEVGTTEDSYLEDHATRRARTSWIGPDDETGWIFDALAEVALRANRTYRFDLIGFTEELQFTHYDEPGAFYDWHQDGLEGEVAGRKLSLVVQLTDPRKYTGGDLEIFSETEEGGEGPSKAWRRRVRRRGTVIAFPAFEHHRVLPIEAGVRYSMVAWIGGPPFR